MSKIFKKIFGFKEKVNNQNIDEGSKEVFKVNLKGQRVLENQEGGLNRYNMDHINKKEQGPPMLNMRTRIKVWGALFGTGIYFYLCYKLIKFRLKADDLDLMEREVNEEFKLKLKINEFNNPDNLNKN